MKMSQYKNVHHSQKLEIAPASTNEKMDKQTGMCSHGVVLFSNKKEETTDHTKPWLNP